jgi:hypothetical protein
MHLEWIRDSSTPRGSYATQDWRVCLFLMVRKQGGQRHGRSIHNSLHRH